MSHIERELLETLQCLDLDLQLRDRPRRGRLIENLFFDSLNLVVRRLVEVVDVLFVECRNGVREHRSILACSMEYFKFAQPRLQPLAATT
jgi:hypothetical protein